MKKHLWDILVPLITAVVILFIGTHIVNWGYVKSASMEPTLMTGDICINNLIAYKFGNTPQRGDIILFYGTIDDERSELTKRVIGLPGDVIAFMNGDVYINGELYIEEYLEDDVQTYGYGIFEVPEDSYFVLGDNRESSYDSRFWDNPYVAAVDIRGKILFTFSIF